MEKKIHEFSGFSYMRISELPEDERKPFTKALRGQTRPVIPDIEPQDAFYPCDYDKWKIYGDRLPPAVWD